jgi:excinuclease ABC subunit A
MRIEMYFLADVYATCDICKGRRYNRETLAIKYKGHSIADVLELTVVQALDLFAQIPAIADRLHALIRVGLGYLQLGQAAQTLSGGESQRLRLAKELGRRSSGRSLYVLDEPTSGLHYADVELLLELLHRLVDAGNTLVVIEHNLEIIKNADYVIDLGPGAGKSGGRVIARGTPEEVARVAQSHTGRYLTKVLSG